jgi:hypothetical protein
MDPRLQLAVANTRSGKRGLPLSSTQSDEIAVIARVKDVEVWRSLPDVVPGSLMGQTPDGTWIVTGRVPVRRAEAVHAEDNVLSLKASQPVHPTLASTLNAMQVATLPPQIKPNGGSGVIVGIVDFGCDFAHRNFRKPDGSRSRPERGRKLEAE